jgi:serine/threonine-protein kinase mTOR
VSVVKRLAACLALKEFAIHAPAAFHSKTSQSTLGQGGSNEFLDYIFQAIRDPQPIVRACATDALSECLEIIVERRHPSLTGLLCQVHFSLMEGLQQDYYATRKKTRPPWATAQAEAASQHGSLLVVSSVLAYTRNFMLPRYEEVCRAVLAFTDCPKALIRLEVVRLIPRLARRSPRVFGRRYLEQALVFLIDVVESLTSSSLSTSVDVRSSAFMAIGELILAMADETTGHLIGGSQLPTIKISNNPENPQCHRVELSQRGIVHEKLPEVFMLVRKGLEPALRNVPPGQQSSMIRPALHCAANLVDALGDMALPYVPDLIDRMFRAGLSNDLIRCLHSIAQCLPAQQGEIEDRMLQEVSVCLAGVQDVYDPLGSFRSSVHVLQTGGRPDYASSPRLDNVQAADAAAEAPGVVTNMDDDDDTVRSLVLSLQTLASFGGRMGRSVSFGSFVPLLPFVQDVVSRYLSHASNEVRRAAALTCCMLLIPHDAAAAARPVGSYSGMLIENVLSRLLRVAISDSSAIVRLCVVRALDSRYDSYLCQTHHLQELFLLLQDETLATKAASLQLLGRLAAINPAPILPVLRLFLNDIIVELQVDSGRGREEATRLLVVFLRAKSLQRLIHPLLASIVCALPLEGAAQPRLAAAALEALGHLALATGIELQPWVNEVIPHVLDIMQDQSSASKQRTSLRTLGQIAGSTGYVIQPYLDYPRLLSHATDILPATKRAPWSLRREVIRTLGILGALDPDRYFAVASKTRKRGAVGGAYFEEMDLPDVRGGGLAVEQTTPVKVLSKTSAELGRKRSRSELPSYLGDGDDDQPASLFMYEQYSMVSQPVSSLPPAKKMTPADEEFYPTVVSVKHDETCRKEMSVPHLTWLTNLLIGRPYSRFRR